jgi:hypothetical protein
MRTVETKVFSFNELSEDSKENAIEQVRNYYCNYNEFGEWAKDDCWLLNPPHKDVKKYNLKNNILLSNNRKNIYFSIDRNWFLDCQEAIAVEDENAFLDWLGLPKELASKTEYEIFTPSFRNADTKIEFTHNENEDFTDSEEDYLGQAMNKFETHINNCLKGIEDSINYRFTDEAIMEDIEANEYEFEEDGTQF